MTKDSPRYHLSPITGNYRRCTANKKPCKYEQTSLGEYSHIDQQEYEKIEERRKELGDFFGHSFNYEQMLEHDSAKKDALASLHVHGDVDGSTLAFIVGRDPRRARSQADGMISAELEEFIKDGKDLNTDRRLLAKERKRILSAAKKEHKRRDVTPGAFQDLLDDMRAGRDQSGDSVFLNPTKAPRS